MSIPTMPFGANGPDLTRIGLGGEGVLRTHGRDREAQAVIQEAIDLGITYFDSAAAYAGSQAYLGQVWRKRPDDREKIFQTSKSAQRSASAALSELENTLRTMGLEYLDLWQIHDVRTMADFNRIAGPSGALEAFVQAKKQGKVRFIGVTGHHDPAILTLAAMEWPVDSVLLPVNPVEAVLGGFLDQTVPAAREKGLAVIGMKVLGASHYLAPQADITADRLIRFALSQPVTHAIVGCSTPDEVRRMIRSATESRLMSRPEQEQLIELFRPHARRLAYYRGTV